MRQYYSGRVKKWDLVVRGHQKHCYRLKAWPCLSSKDIIKNVISVSRKTKGFLFYFLQKSATRVNVHREIKLLQEIFEGTYLIFLSSLHYLNCSNIFDAEMAHVVNIFPHGRERDLYPRTIYYVRSQSNSRHSNDSIFRPQHQTDSYVPRCVSL